MLLFLSVIRIIIRGIRRIQKEFPIYELMEDKGVFFTLSSSSSGFTFDTRKVEIKWEKTVNLF